MAEQPHPITPPPELVKQWIQAWYDAEVRNVGVVPHVATQAARWGADVELEACCEWLETGPYGFSIEATAPRMTKRLRTARRTKPPSLKEQALEDFNGLMSELDGAGNYSNCAERIRRALEALPND